MNYEERMAFARTLKWSLKVRAFAPGETKTTKLPGGGTRTVTNPGVTVRELMEKHGGPHAEIEDPFGNKHQLSLVEWADRPETRLDIGFTSSKFRADKNGNPITT